MYQPHDHGESVYNLIAPKMLEPLRPTMYQSRHNWSRPPSASTFHQKSTSHPIVSNLAGDAMDKIVADKERQTFGKPLGLSRNEPSKYLGKGLRSFSVPSLREVKQKNPEQLKPSKLRPLTKASVPRSADQPIMNLVTSRNFIVSNAVDVILKQPRPRVTQEKDYLKKEDYGKVPTYLHQVKKDVEEEYAYVRAMDEDLENANMPPVRTLDEDERLRLMEGLKIKWEKLNHQYQHHTHLTKLEAGKVRRKERWDAELQNLEKDLAKLSKNNITIDMAS